MPAAIRPAIALEAADLAAPLGAERVRLLETVGREGSISAAARSLGISYKHAWEGIAALNNLAGRPLVDSRKGGAKGGGARLTPAGTRFIETFRRLEAETAGLLRRLGEGLDGEGLAAARMVLGGIMQTSARNALAGTVVAIEEGPVSAEVTLELAEGVRLGALITRGSVAGLGLFPGRRVVALVKAPFVILALAEPPLRSSIRNRIEGTVIALDEDGVMAEVTLDIGGGKTLVSVITRASVADLGLAPGIRAAALIDAGHVILAVD